MHIRLNAGPDQNVTRYASNHFVSLKGLGTACLVTSLGKFESSGRLASHSTATILVRSETLVQTFPQGCLNTQHVSTPWDIPCSVVQAPETFKTYQLWRYRKGSMFKYLV